MYGVSNYFAMSPTFFLKLIHLYDSQLFYLFLLLGVTFSESWNTSAEVDTELNYEPSAVSGLKLTLSSIFFPSSGLVTC